MSMKLSLKLEISKQDSFRLENISTLVQATRRDGHVFRQQTLRGSNKQRHNGKSTIASCTHCHFHGNAVGHKVHN